MLSLLGLVRWCLSSTLLFQHLALRLSLLPLSFESCLREDFSPAQTSSSTTAGLVFLIILVISGYVVPRRLPNGVSARLPIRSIDLTLDLVTQVPEIPIMRAVDIMRQLVAQCFANGFVIAISIVRISSQAQLNRLALISVQTEYSTCSFVRRLRVRKRFHLCEDTNGEFVFCHGGANAGVFLEAHEELLAALWVRKTLEWSNLKEGVL
ncbi:hypothetical protein HG531_012467 [Fusarium graminearum]|nr:hypothetical protein HG531_012467 [Fusarium graminearum]